MRATDSELRIPASPASMITNFGTYSTQAIPKQGSATYCVMV
jgi:hypothetical protein